MEIAFSAFPALFLTATLPAKEVAVAIERQRRQTATWPITHSQASKGFFLTRDEHSASYAIILHNVRTYQSGGVIQVVRGKQNAESALKELEASQEPPDHHEGWRYFLERTDMKAGTDPAEATQRRQADLESRESKALQETDPLLRQSSNTRK